MLSPPYDHVVAYTTDLRRVEVGEDEGLLSCTIRESEGEKVAGHPPLPAVNLEDTTPPFLILRSPGFQRSSHDEELSRPKTFDKPYDTTLALATSHAVLVPPRLRPESSYLAGDHTLCCTGGSCTCPVSQDP